jgi:hypothetical protein
MYWLFSLKELLFLLQERIKTVLDRAGLVLNHFESDPRGYAVYIDLPDGSYNSFGGRENGYGIGR